LKFIISFGRDFRRRERRLYKKNKELGSRFLVQEADAAVGFQGHLKKQNQLGSRFLVEGEEMSRYDS